MDVSSGGCRRFGFIVFSSALVILSTITRPVLGLDLPPDQPVTFAGDVAPILFQHCASCHQPGGNAPFSVLSFADVRPRAQQIAAAVTRRYMPPWKPEPGYGTFAGERRLTDSQIDIITRWIAGGALEGDRNTLPPLPPPDTVWPLGPPDLIVDLPEYSLAGGSADLFRNFVAPVGGAGLRYVRGLTFKANSPNVHHANIFVDPTLSSRQLDDDDPLPGYEGLIPSSAAFPDGHFLGWTPGQIAPAEPEAQAWRLPEGGSLLVQLHLMQSETAQRVRPSIGLYFTTTPPTRTPAMLRLGRQNLDIAAGDPAYLAEDSYVLPVDAEVQAIQPHAHRRAKQVKAWATLPDGERRWLIYISAWDFASQDQYRYAAPFWLPAGTRLTLEYILDNSAGNRQNPDSPPSRVLWGQRSTDEMADLWIQLSTRTEADLTQLSTDLRRKMILEDIVGYEVELRAKPDSFVLHNDVAVLYLESGRPVQAVMHFGAVSRLQPGAAAAHFNLGTALEKAGRSADALNQYREAVRLDSTYVRAVKALANALLVDGHADQAIRWYRDLLARDPQDAEGYNNLGFSQIQIGDLPAATVSLQRALNLRPGYPDAHYNLARALMRSGHADTALIHFREAIRLRPDWVPALAETARLMATSSNRSVRRPDEAIEIALHAVDLTNRQDAPALAALAAAYAGAGRFDEAQKTVEAAKAVEGVRSELVTDLEADALVYRSQRAISVP